MSALLTEDRYKQLIDHIRSVKHGSGSYPDGFTVNEKRGLRQQAASFEEKGGVLFYRNAAAATAGSGLRRVVVSKEEKKRLMKACHDGIDGGHFGRDKTLHKVCLSLYSCSFL